MTQFSDSDAQAIRRGAMGAITLVCAADPGIFGNFKESVAAGKVLAAAPADFRTIMIGIDAPPMAKNLDELQNAMLANLDTAVRVASRDPAMLQALKDYVSAGCQQVAEASKGVSEKEQAIINRVMEVVEHASAAAGAGTPETPTTDAAPQVPATPTAPGAPEQTGQVPPPPTL